MREHAALNSPANCEAQPFFVIRARPMKLLPGIDPEDAPARPIFRAAMREHAALNSRSSRYALALLISPRKRNTPRYYPRHSIY